MLTLEEARAQFRFWTRDSTTDFHENAVIDGFLADVIRDDIANDLALSGGYYFSTMVVRAILDALDPGVNEHYPLPERCGQVRYIARGDLAGKPRLWEATPESLDSFRFSSNPNMGTVTLEGATSPFSVPSMFEGSGVLILDNKFRVVPAPDSNAVRYEVGYMRRLGVPSGLKERIDAPDCFDSILPKLAVYKCLMADGDPQAANIGVMLFGEMGREGAIERARKAFKNRAQANVRLGRCRF